MLSRTKATGPLKTLDGTVIATDNDMANRMNNYFSSVKGKGKVFYVQEPPSGESTTTEYGLNYQLLAVMY